MESLLNHIKPDDVSQPLRKKRRKRKCFGIKATYSMLGTSFSGTRWFNTVQSRDGYRRARAGSKFIIDLEDVER